MSITRYIETRVENDVWPMLSPTPHLPRLKLCTPGLVINYGPNVR
jgi:hypothetical protein